MPAPGNHTKYVIFYESGDEAGTKARAHCAAHWARGEEFHARGVLLMVGMFTDRQDEGAMAVFTTREAAEEFAEGDPFVRGRTRAPISGKQPTAV